MAKTYIDANKLKTEIKRLTNQKKEKLKRFSDEDYTCSVASSINCKLRGNEEVLSLIDSLQQEQQEVDLKKEIDRELDTRWKGEYLSTSKFRESARHFYELGLNARKEK